MTGAQALCNVWGGGVEVEAWDSVSPESVPRLKKSQKLFPPKK